MPQSNGQKDTSTGAPHDISFVEMWRAHPNSRSASPDMVSCIAACDACERICAMCVDACLAEDDATALRACIRLNQDCAYLCAATATILSRQTTPNPRVIAATLNACAIACAECASECEGHAEHMEHCRVCAEACRACERACLALAERMSGMGGV
jgi:hypothetical protein